MGYRSLIASILFTFLASCSYDLDVSGLVYTPVPVNQRFSMSQEWNATHPERKVQLDSSTYTLFFAGDSHVGGTRNLELYLDAAESENAVAIAIAGDVSTGKADDYELLSSALSRAGETPVCLVTGNHDLYFGGWDSFYALFGSSTYTFTVETPEGTDLYIFLDTGGGTHGPDQLEWLRLLLEDQRDAYRFVCVTSHVNYFRNRFTGSTNILNEELIAILHIFAENKVDMVIQGHDHSRYEEVFGGTSYITLDALKDGYKDASYMQVRVTPSAMTYQFHTL